MTTTTKRPETYTILASQVCMTCEWEGDDVPTEVSADGTVESYKCPTCDKTWTGTNDAEIAAGVRYTILRTRIDAYVAEAQRVMGKQYAEHYPNLTPDTLSAEYVSDKWAKIITTRAGTSGRSVHSFVCLKDGETKALGKVTAGDIHKAAGWKAPAKHARGSVLDLDFGNCLTPFGVAYLR